MSISNSCQISCHCDSRTRLSVGLGLLGAGVSAAALIVLGNLGYMSMTTAYISSSAVGISFLLIGIAIASIRSKPELPTEHSISNRIIQREWVSDTIVATDALKPPSCFSRIFVPHSAVPLEECTVEEITTWLESDLPIEHYHSFTFQPPGINHPYAYLNMNCFACIEGKKPFLFEDIRFSPRLKDECWELTFEYNNKIYTKKACSKYQVPNPRLSEWRTIEEDFIFQLRTELSFFASRNGFFLQRDIRILEKIGCDATLFYDPFNSETVMTNENDAEECRAFDIPDILDVKIHENSVIFTRDATKDLKQVQHLDAHPALQAQLKSPQWKWDFPPHATSRKVSINRGVVFVEYEVSALNLHCGNPAPLGAGKPSFLLIPWP